jgi:hypothetical protein
MKLNKGLLGLALAFVILFSVAGLLQRQREVESVSSKHTTSMLQRVNISEMYPAMNYPFHNYDFLTVWLASLPPKARLPRKRRFQTTANGRRFTISSAPT